MQLMQPNTAACFTAGPKKPGTAEEREPVFSTVNFNVNYS